MKKWVPFLLYDLVSELGLEPDEAIELQKRFWEVIKIDYLNELFTAVD
jgi:hypothetical protein